MSGVSLDVEVGLDVIRPIDQNTSDCEEGKTHCNRHHVISSVSF